MDYKYPKIRLGLCCINMTLRYNEQIYTSRKRISATILKNGLELVRGDAIQNVLDLAKMICWNKNHGIDVVRISSELVPHATNPKIIEAFGNEGKEYAQFEFLRKYLKEVGNLARKENMRLTFHPAQFVQLGSPTESVFHSSVRELAMHARFLDMMEMGNDSVMVIHLGGTYGEKENAIARFKKRYASLPDFIKKRLVFENDEKCYDAVDVLQVCKDTGVPMVFDIFHYYCYKKYHSDENQKSIDEMMPDILKTWVGRGARPKFHLSEQKLNAPIGSHALFVETIPKELLEVPTKYNVSVDIMLEAKGKEVAIAKLYEKYPDLQPPYVEPLPLNIPKKALKDMNLSEDDFCASCSEAQGCTTKNNKNNESGEEESEKKSKGSKKSKVDEH